MAASPAATVLHTYSDGCQLRLTTAKALIQIPIWKGNRVKDNAHVTALKEAVGSAVQTLDRGYHVIKYREPDAAGTLVEQSYIIDGQHRASVLIDFFASHLCEPDFPVTYIEAVVDNEADAIAYFNRINNVKPIHYKEDPILVANRYVEQIVRALPGTKSVPLFRDKATHRPYMGIDKLRDLLVGSVDKLVCSPAAFARRVVEKNRRLIDEAALGLATGSIPKKEVSIVTRAIELDFALGIDPAKWFAEIVAGAK
jgi:hypothetical protein